MLYDTIDKEKEFQLNWTDFVNFLLEHLIPLPQTKLLLGATEISAVPHVKVNSYFKSYKDVNIILFAKVNGEMRHAKCQCIWLF